MRRLTLTSPRLYALLIISSLLFLGTAQAAWTYGLQIIGTINTSEAAMSFVASFTNDDGSVDDPELDPGDEGSCPPAGRPESSCDPVGGDQGQVGRRDKDVAACTTRIASDGLEAEIITNGGYPGYQCTGWFTARNTGSLPLRLSGLTLNGKPMALESERAVDLNGDDRRDARLEVEGLEICQQLDPGDEVRLQLNQHLLGGVPPNSSLEFTIEAVFSQWNQPCDNPQIATEGEGP